jgi:hypothetical protein
MVDELIIGNGLEIIGHGQIEVLSKNLPGGRDKHSWPYSDCDSNKVFHENESGILQLLQNARFNGSL